VVVVDEKVVVDEGALEENEKAFVSKAATFLCVKRVFTGYVAYCELSKC